MEEAQPPAEPVGPWYRIKAEAKHYAGGFDPRFPTNLCVAPTTPKISKSPFLLTDITRVRTELPPFPSLSLSGHPFTVSYFSPHRLRYPSFSYTSTMSVIPLPIFILSPH